MGLRSLLTVQTPLVDYMSTPWNKQLLSIVFFAIGLPVAGTVAVLVLITDWRGVHEPLHMIVETAGAALALTLIILLTASHHVSEIIRQHERAWLSLALVTMALLDTLHAIAPPGNAFVWLHSLAALVGGLSFAGVWLGPRIKPGAISFTVMVSLWAVFGIMALVHPELVPQMVDGDGFTPLASVLNIGAGLGFFAAGTYFLRQMTKRENRALHLVAAHCMLFGVASVLFETSSIWDGAWWWWHVLRLVAYAVLLGIFIEVAMIGDGWNRSRFDFKTDILSTIGRLGGATICLILGVIVIIGWIAQIPGLIQIAPQFAPMQFTTALCFLLCGGVLLGLGTERRMWWVNPAAFLTATVAGLSLASHSLGLDTPLDRITAPLDFPNTAHSGRMSVNTALGFLLCAAAILLPRIFANHWMVQFLVPSLSLVGFTIAAASLTGYMLGFQASDSLFGLCQMAVHTSVGLAGLTIGIMAHGYLEREKQGGDQGPYEIILGGFLVAALTELHLPDHANSGIFYVPVLLGALALRQQGASYVLAALATANYLLYAPALFAGNTDQPNNAGMILAEIIVIWAVATFVYLWKRQSNALLVVEQRYESAVLGSKIGLWDWNIEKDELHWSPRFFDMVGLKPKTSPLRFSFFASYLHPDDLDRVSAEVQDHLEHKTPFLTEYRLCHSSGHDVWVQAQGQAEWNGQGQAIRMSGSVSDITAMKVLSNERERQLELLRFAEQIASMGNWFVDIETGAVDWSDEVYRIHGLEPGTMGLDLETGLNLYLEEDKPLVAAHVEKAIATGKGFNFQARIQRFDGTIRHVQSKGEVALDSRGKPVSIFGVFQDITDLWLTTEQLKESEARFAAAVEGLSVGVWDWIDVGEKAEWWSPRFYALLGYEDREIPASVDTFRANLHPDDVVRTFEAVTDHFEGKGPFRVEYRLKTRSGAYRWFLGTGQAIRAADGTPVRMIGSIMDIHDLKLSNAALQESVDKLETANRELDHFAYIASHDLRAPLRGISNAATWLEEDLSDQLTEESTEHLRLLRSRVDRMERLLSDLLAYSRAGRRESEPAMVDCSLLVEDVIEWVVPPPGFTIRILTPLPTLFIAQTLLEHVFLNLIGNAIKHHDRTEGEVTISYARSDEMHHFIVADDGPGIPERFQEKAFAMFQTLQSRDKKEGSGIGLAIVKKMVASVDGNVELRSPLTDRGTAFHVVLPIQYADETLNKEVCNGRTGTGIAAAG